MALGFLSAPEDVFSISLGYLIGSIPFGPLLVQTFHKSDIRLTGSGNIGATNILRSGFRICALIALILDFAKPTISALSANLILHLLKVDSSIFDITSKNLPLVLAATAAVIGHIFSCFLKFKGGKGIASFFGFLFLMNWNLALFVCSVWLGVFAISRISSLASILALVVLVVISVLLINEDMSSFYILLGIVCLLRHSQNLVRLLRREEKPLISSRN